MKIAGLIKFILKLAVAALVANAAWHLLTPYTAYYRFKDSVEAASLHGSDQTEERLRQRVLELAAQFDVPVTAGSFTLRRDHGHTIVDGSYTRSVELLPGFSYPWLFTWHVDTFNLR